MTRGWCPECLEYRDNYIDDDGDVRGITCGHLLDGFDDLPDELEASSP